jgi:FAD-dependent oxidoreductase domain-containing protein 1
MGCSSAWCAPTPANYNQQSASFHVQVDCASRPQSPSTCRHHRDRAQPLVRILCQLFEPKPCVKSAGLLRYTRASSALSVSSIRQQFSNSENIQVRFYKGVYGFKSHFLSLYSTAPDHIAQMSLFSAGFIKNATDWGLDDVQFWEGGYLFLATREKEAILKRNTALQQDLGASIRLMWDPSPYFTTESPCQISHGVRRSPSELVLKFPWLRVDDISCGALGVKNEGWFDPWQLLFAFKKSAGVLGVKFVTGEVTGINHRSACAESVVVTSNPSPSSSSSSSSSSSTNTTVIPCDVLINAAGPWAAPITSLGILTQQILGSDSSQLLSFHLTCPCRPPPPLCALPPPPPPSLSAFM